MITATAKDGSGKAASATITITSKKCGQKYERYCKHNSDCNTCNNHTSCTGFSGGDFCVEQWRCRKHPEFEGVQGGTCTRATSYTMTCSIP